MGRKGRRFLNEKGVALVTVSLASVLISMLAALAFGKAFFEMRNVEREMARVRSFAAAEAGVQSAMAQMGVDAYTGFIDTEDININTFQNVNGIDLGSIQVSMEYPNDADWVIVTSTGSVGGDTRSVEGRVFLDSNLSKYLVYADTSNFNSGSNAQYGEPDYTDVYGDGEPDYPEFVPPDENDRAALYFTGDWTTSGSNVTLYGDAHTEGGINGNMSSYVHGDTYASEFALNAWGEVTNDGVSGGLNVGDGFDDDLDRNSDGTVDADDYPDYHDLTSSGSGDSHARETLVEIDHTFYANNNDVPTYAGASSQSRYLKFETSADGNSTKIVEYNNPDYDDIVATRTLPPTAIVYVKGDAYVKGNIKGRVTVVSSDDIFFMGDTNYTSNQKTVDPYHSAAYLAKDKLYFIPNDLEVSGILYAENSSGSSVSFNANYVYNSRRNRFDYDPYDKEYLRLYGNRIIKGSTNLGNYNDRIYGYDKNLKYYRPPGIPVKPDLRLSREVQSGD